MVELVLLACLLKSPQQCETFHLQFQEDIALPQCIWRSQLKAAQWSAEHPGWEIRRFTCELPHA